MKIAIDIREACKKQRDGKAQWTYGMACTLLETSHKIIAFTDSPIPPEWDGKFESVETHTPGILWHAWARTCLKQMELDKAIWPTSTIVPAFAPKSVQMIPVIHDLIAFLDEPHNKKAKLIERYTVPRALRKAHSILTVSQATKDDVLSRFHYLNADSITVVGSGSHDSTITEWQSDRTTILCIATLCPRKNQLRLIEAYTKLPEDLKNQYSLLLVGKSGWDDDQIIDMVEQTEGVYWEGYVTDEEYADLLSSCAVFVYPSLYEGFGIPVLDALQRGTPVVTSNISSMPEVAGSAAEMVDPYDSGDIARGIAAVLTDLSYQEQLSTKGKKQAEKWTWNAVRDKILACL